MSLNSFLQFFVTKETKFFPIYIKQSELLVHATKTLLEMVKIDDYEERKLLGRQIKKDETDGDELFRNLYKMLNITFITPFDREDVNELAANMDDSLDIEIPKAAALLRELTIASSNLNSHAIHHFLVAPDFVPEDLFKTAVDSVGTIRKTAQYVVDMVAGEGIHPSDVRIGGMARNLSELARKKLYTRMKALVPVVDNHVELMTNLILEKDIPEGLGAITAPVFASDVIYGKREFFDLDRFTEIVPELWYDDPEIGKRACTTVPLYDGLNVETGPRARLDKFQGYKEKGVVAQHLARAREMKTYLSRAIAILDELDTAANTLADFDPRGTNKLGIGVVEAPRGTDIHMAQVKDGKTAFYSALVPTTWNIPTMGPATEGFHHDFGPHVIRAYDPCLSCATHVMVVDDEDKSILKNEMVRI